jgi:hypothetical protein
MATENKTAEKGLEENTGSKEGGAQMTAEAWAAKMLQHKAMLLLAEKHPLVLKKISAEVIAQCWCHLVEKQGEKGLDLGTGCLELCTEDKIMEKAEIIAGVQAVLEKRRPTALELIQTLGPLVDQPQHEVWKKILDETRKEAKEEADQRVAKEREAKEREVKEKEAKEREAAEREAEEKEPMKGSETGTEEATKRGREMEEGQAVGAPPKKHGKRAQHKVLELVPVDSFRSADEVIAAVARMLPLSPQTGIPAIIVEVTMHPNDMLDPGFVARELLDELRRAEEHCKGSTWMLTHPQEMMAAIASFPLEAREGMNAWITKYLYDLACAVRRSIVRAELIRWGRETGRPSEGHVQYPVIRNMLRDEPSPWRMGQGETGARTGGQGYGEYNGPYGRGGYKR